MQPAHLSTVMDTSMCEQQRDEDAALYRGIFERAAVGMAHVGLDGRWLRVNACLCEMLSYTADELYTRTFMEVTHPDDLALDLANKQALLDGMQETYTIEKRYLRKDGSPLWVNLTVSLERDDANAPLRYISIIQDIDARKQLEAELQAASQQLSRAALLAQRHADEMEAIVEVMTDAVSLFDAQGHVLMSNARARDLLGKYAQPENYDLLSVTQRGNLYAPRDEQGHPLPKAQWPMTRILTGEVLSGPTATDMRLRALDGREVYFNVSGTPLRDKDGHIIGGVTIARDVTDRRRMEAESQEMAARLNAMIAANTFGVIVANATRILEANDAFLQMVGYSRDDLEAGLVGRAEMTPPEYLPLNQQALTELMTTGACIPFEKEYLRKDNSRVPVLFSAVRFTTDPVQWVGFVLDMSKQKSLEWERGQMLHIVGHELRTPLTSLKARVQLLQRRLAKANSPDADLAAQAEEDIARIQRLVNDLNEGAALERGTLQLDRHPIDLAALCRQTVDDLERTSGRQIQSDIPRHPIAVHADPQRIQQVLTNLLNNAVKYTPLSATITLAAREADGQVRIEVRDTGPGIAEHAQSHLFERFYRVPGGAVYTGGSHVGVGLGLFIARTIVEAHGGQMGVKSMVGQGTTFWVTLPLT